MCDASFAGGDGTKKRSRLGESQLTPRASQIPPIFTTGNFSPVAAGENLLDRVHEELLDLSFVDLIGVSVAP